VADFKVSRIKMDPKGMAQIELRAAKLVGRVLEDVAEDMRRIVPKDTEELHDSIEVEHEPGELSGTVNVGTDHWAPTEYGSDPHIIESGGFYSLHNSETGEYFGEVVLHPGTPEQPFIRPALYQKRRYKLTDLD